MGKTTIGKRIYRTIGEEVNSLLIRWVMLREALKKKRSADFAEFYYRIASRWLGDKLMTIQLDSDADRCAAFADLVSEGLRPARICLWWTGSKYRIALYCESLEVAVCTWALSMVLGGKWLAVCPYSNHLFVQSSQDQTWCCRKHREAGRVARFRQEQKRRTKGDSRPAS